MTERVLLGAHVVLEVLVDGRLTLPSRRLSYRLVSQGFHRVKLCYQFIVLIEGSKLCPCALSCMWRHGLVHIGLVSQRGFLDNHVSLLLRNGLLLRGSLDVGSRSSLVFFLSTAASIRKVCIG